MAASARKKTTKKSPAKKKPAAGRKTEAKKETKAQTNFWHMPLVRLCFLLFMIVVSIVSLFQLGVIGSFLYHFVMLLIGWQTIPFFAGCIALCAVEIYKKQHLFTRRNTAGFLLLVSGFALMLGCMEYKNVLPGQVFFQALSQAMDVLKGQSSQAGLLGAFFYTVFASLVDRAGAWLFSILFFVLAMVLFGWSWSVSDLAKKVRNRPKVIKQSAETEQEPKPAKKARRPYGKEDRQEEMPALPQEDSGSFRIIEADRVMEVSMNEDMPPLPAENPEPVRKKRSKSKKVREKEPRFEEQKLFLDADEPQKPKPAENPFDDYIEETNQALQARAARTRKKAQEAEDPFTPPSEYKMVEDPYADYKMPTLALLADPARRSRSNANITHASAQGKKLIEILRQFNVNASLKDVHIGPSVTKFELTLQPGTRVNKITSLAGDIKMALAATDIRIEAPIPGKSAVGIEVPNVQKTTVNLKEVLQQVPKQKEQEKLLVALGKDLLGECVFGYLNKMPHLLIAGATGSGKSVCVNSIICSLLLRTRPDEVKLVLIDPKKVEFTPYKDVPHLLAPVITDGELASKALQVVVRIMDARYDLFQEYGVRNMEGYNSMVRTHPELSLKPLPRIVVIIDELADLMLVAAKEVEQSIQRITQLARAAGIHLIVATQRPSVDIITGVIKANIPSRIAFAVSQAVDSRTILDQAGAEKLLGYGDMLYLPNGETAAQRVQGVFIADEEVARICQYVKAQGLPLYDDAFLAMKDMSSSSKKGESKSDPLYDEVKRFVIASKRASTSLIQRKFSIGYGRAARLLDSLEENGIVSAANGSKPRKILVQNTFEDEDEIL